MEVRNGSPVARTILHQLGGTVRLHSMLGARQFYLADDHLAFALPSNFAKKNINRISIRLAPNDTYIVTFGSYRAGKYKVIAEYSDIYESVLKSLIEQETGLWLSL